MIVNEGEEQLRELGCTFDPCLVKYDKEDVDQGEPNLLGRGTFGRVYAAHHRTTGQPLAVKVISIDSNPSGVRAADRWIKAAVYEAYIMCALKDYDTVCACYGAFFEYHEHRSKNQVVCSIVMERCRLPLDKWLRPGGTSIQLTMVEKVQVVYNLARCVKTLQETHIAHSDLKPNNFLIAISGTCWSCVSCRIQLFACSNHHPNHYSCCVVWYLLLLHRSPEACGLRRSVFHESNRSW